MSTEQQNLSSTKDLNRTLTRGSLMGIAIGQIIGAGIMSLVGVGIEMTGRSVNISFVVSAVFTIFVAVPYIFVFSVLRLRGGMYSQMALFGGDRLAGIYTLIYLASNMSLAMYAISFAQYFLGLFELTPKDSGYAFPAKIVGIVIITLFCVLNIFGTEWMSRVQNLLVIVLVCSLLLFAFFGIPQVDFGNYFNNGDQWFMTKGVGGIMEASAYLTFATGGATIITGVAGECVNPKKDIPWVIIVSTIGVAIVYAFVATTAAGVLPTKDVAGQSLIAVANQIFPRPIYYIFIIGGALFALATTLNSQIVSVSRVIMQICEDGWFPKGLAKLHPKFKTPIYILGLYWVIGVLPVALGLDISAVASIVQILGYVSGIAIFVATMKLPKMFPEAWEKSPFHCSDGAFKAWIVVAIITYLVQFYFMISSVIGKGQWWIVWANAIFLVVAVIFGTVMHKSGKAKVTVSYELE